MISSASCSNRARAVALLVAAALGGLGVPRALAQAPAAEARSGASPGTAEPIALFPPANLTGAVAPMREITALLEKALRDRGVPVVSGPQLEDFLARHRIRYTGGLAPEDAVRARNELGVRGVLITTLTAWQQEPPRLAAELRVVSTEEVPRILWADGVSRAGDESPGLFELGVITDYRVLAGRVFADLAGSLASWQAGKGERAHSCASAGRFSPKVSFRAPSLDPSRRWTVAVLPFVDETGRRNAGEVVPLLFVRQLLASGRFEVVEPGAVRDELLRFRIVMEGGVSLDTARIVMELFRADLVLAGTVHAFRDSSSGAGAPAAQFTALLLDRKDSEVLWESSSENQGDDGVFFFDAGKVSTVGALTCRMARSMVDSMLEKRSPPPKRRLSP